MTPPMRVNSIGEMHTRSGHAGRHRTAAPSARLSLLILAAAYTLFVIYGSLVPLNYQHHSWPEAVYAFRNIRHLTLGIGSRADWVANILLFVPLAFIWLGTIWHPKNIGWRLVATLAVLFSCICLSLAIEFTQIFFPPRTVSLNDIYAESMGALIGSFLWWVTGASVTRWYLGWRAAEGQVAFSQRLLYGYLFLLFGYNLLPLDLTLSPVELFHKWHEGRIIFVPFTHQSGDWAQLAYGLLADVLVWVPAGILARLAAKRNSASNWLLLTAAAALLELLQLFVYTRVTDTTDILTGSLGAAIGIWLAGHWHSTPASAQVFTPSPRKSLGDIAALIAANLFWLLIVYAVFWYPFNFQSDGMFVSGRLAEAVSRVPFSAYYFGTEYRAITEVLHKAGFFFPLGWLLVSLARRIRIGSPTLWKIGALAVVAIVAASVEAGQLFLPGKNADLTDWVLEMVGGWAGWALAWRIRSMHHAPNVPNAPAAPILPESRHRPWIMTGALALGLALTLWVATHISAVPYNVRELVAQEHPLSSALLLACAVVWVFGFPALAVARMLSNNADGAISLPVRLLLHALVAWVLLRLAVPLESIHDIVGSPVLGWPWEWELIGRFVGLFALWSAIAFGTSLIALRPWVPGTGSFLGVWSMLLAVLLPIAHVVVIQQAATDNITELIAGNGSPMASLWIAMGIFMFSLAGAQLAVGLGVGTRASIMRGAIWSIASFPLTYLALNAGLEPYIMKYDQVFSALQFLLSQDRSHYATPIELLLRYGAAHAALLSVATASQVPFLRLAVRAGTRPGTPPSVNK